MLQNLSQYLTQTDTETRSEYTSASDVAEYRRALCERAMADASLRQAKAAMWGAKNPMPDLQSGETWALRPSAWSRAAVHRHLVGAASGTEIAPALTLYHDCPHSLLSLRQDLTSPDAPAPFSLCLDVLQFEGSFLSLCFNLDPEEAKQLRMDDVIRVGLDAEMEAPLPLYARLNLKQSPNETQQLSQFGFGNTTSGRQIAAFDLAYAGLSDDPVEAAWIDLIFEKPAMNAVRMHDMVVSRGKRASL
ncbi:MAG: DUF6478 family protein [Pseudomonadota bacterium]